ncbi:Thrombospondin type-1 (TSP1) repeat, partial [Trinorchestia longiramus]
LTFFATGAWGVCWSESGCGHGVEQRTVWCADTLTRTVPASLCEASNKPPDTRHCYTTCQGGTWQAGPWSDCHIDSLFRHLNDGLCHGTHYRNVSCLTQASDKVPPLPCTGPEPQREAPCTVPCPKNCVVGPWSDWTRCTICGKLQSRNRAVLKAPSKRGKQCPRLTEVRTCDEDCNLPTTTTTHKPLKPWLEVGQWGDCKPLETDQIKSAFQNNNKDQLSPELISLNSLDDEDEGLENSGDCSHDACTG